MNNIGFKNMLNNLPKQKGIMAREEYLNSAVLIPFILINDEYHILFQVRAKGIRQGTEICFPGGGFDEHVDKTYEDTVIRETREELGLSKNDFEVIGFLDSYVAPMGAIIEPFIGLLNPDAIEKINIDKNEVEKIFTLPVSFFWETKPEVYYARLEIQAAYKDKNGEEKIILHAKELGLPERYYKSWGGKKHKIYFYQTEHGVLWGLTAAIIQDLIKKIR